MAGVAWPVPAPVFKAGGARREALLGGFDSHRSPPRLLAQYSFRASRRRRGYESSPLGHNPAWKSRWHVPMQ
jgi:hypothetical protein